MNLTDAQQLTEQYVFDTYRRVPLLITRGKGAYIFDDTGKKYLDFFTGIAVNAAGHGNARIRKAIASQAATLVHMSNLYYTEPMITLAQRLTTLAAMDKIFYCNSGAEANEAAIKLVRRYNSLVARTGRDEIICMKQSFHGRTVTTVTATGQDIYKNGFAPLTPGFVHATMNDIESVRSLVTDKTAAIMVEPVQGESGVHPATDAFMQGLDALRAESGIQLIFDEVQCGLGRTGKWFAWEHYGVKPDVITIAKPIGGGLPLGAMMAHGPVSSGFVPGAHASTFGANPVACAAANAFIDEMTDRNLVAQAAEMGSYISDSLRDLAAKSGAITDIRGKGLMIGLDIRGNAADAAAWMRDHGIIIGAGHENTVRVLPPYIVERRQIDSFVKTFARCLKAVCKKG